MPQEIDPKRQNPQNTPSPDNILIENVKKSAIAAGQGAKAILNTFNINISGLPLAILIAAPFIAFIVLIAAITLTVIVSTPTQSPIPEKMSGQFNVAIAPFIVIDSDGSIVDSEDGVNFAQFLYNQLEIDLAALDLPTSYQLRPPQYTEAIVGSTPAERAEFAEKIAEKINAQLIIYGAITKSGDQSELRPEFYVNYRGFHNAKEFTGQHSLGSPLLLNLPFDPQIYAGVNQAPIISRIQTLSLITIGLSYYSARDFMRAITYFEQALEIPSSGKEVIHLLKGNAYIRLASDQKTQFEVQKAIEQYEMALAIDHNYARAKVGLSGGLYMTSLGTPTDETWESVDLMVLDEAEAGYLDALEKEAPISANIPAKVNFGLGQIYFLRAKAQDQEAVHTAITYFQLVISEYENGNKQITELAALSQIQLADINAYIFANFETAKKHYEAAIEISSDNPSDQSKYYEQLADLYIAIGEERSAIEALNNAENIARSFINEDVADGFKEKAATIEAQRE